MRIKAVQDRCIASEGVIRQYCKCQEIENKEQAQYSETVYTRNQELTSACRRDPSTRGSEEGEDQFSDEIGLYS